MSQFGNLRRSLLFFGALLMLWATPTGLVGAQGPAASSEPAYPIEAAQRPLTLPARRLRVDVDQTAVGFTSTGNVKSPYWSLALGGAVGVGGGIELGLSAHREGPAVPSHGVYAAGAPAVILAPSDEIGNVPMYVRGQLVRTEKVEAVLDVGVLIPVQSDFAVDFGILMRIYAHPRLTLDVGGQYLFVMQPEDVAGCPNGAACNDGTAMSLWLPLAGTVQLTRFLYAQVETGMELDHTYAERWTVPLGLRLGLTVPAGAELLDLGVSASWPRLVRPLADDPTTTDLWQLQLSVQGNLGF